MQFKEIKIWFKNVNTNYFKLLCSISATNRSFYIIIIKNGSYVIAGKVQKTSNMLNDMFVSSKKLCKKITCKYVQLTIAITIFQVDKH